MHKALKPLVLLFAVALVVTVLVQPANASYDPGAARQVVKRNPVAGNVRQLAAENARLRKELKAARERTRRTQKALEEMRRKLGLLRETVQLREKLNRQAGSKRKPSVASGKEARQPELKKVLCKAAPAASGGTKSTPQRPGVVERILRSERITALRRKLEELVVRHWLVRPQTVATRRKCEGNSGMEKKAAGPKGAPQAEPLRKRIETLKNRLKSKLEARLKGRLKSVSESTPAREKAKKQPQKLRKPSAPQVQKRLRDELLKQLRRKFRRELEKKLKGLRREVESKKRRSVWF
jgi:outer membrane murein-binding lipoprotein Lpp